MTETIDPQLLTSLVPINALTVDHARTLLRNKTVDLVCQGEKIFSRGDCDGEHIYLLSGSVEITYDDGPARQFDAGDPLFRFPLEHHQPRRVTVTATRDCSILTFNSDMLDGMLAWDQAANHIILDVSSKRELDEDAGWMLTLLRSNLFYRVSPMNIRQVLDKFEPVYVSSGQTILRQGELGDCCYFIKEGIADVYQSPDEKSSPELVAELGVGRFFGEEALINEAVRNATIIMQTNGVLMKLEKQDFFVLLKPPMVQQINFRDAKQQFSDGSWLDVRTHDEYEDGHYRHAINMPVNLLKLKSRLLDKSQHYILYCNTGRRSDAAAHLLGEEGFQVSSLKGGINGLGTADQTWFEFDPSTL